MNEKIEIELAKSWFILAEILMIFSGIMFAAAGLSYAAAQDSLSRAYENYYEPIRLSREIVLDKLTLNSTQWEKYEEFYNLTTEVINTTSQVKQNWGNLTMVNLNFWKIYLLVGLFTLILSLAIFGWGQWLLRNLKNKINAQKP